MPDITHDKSEQWICYVCAEPTKDIATSNKRANDESQDSSSDDGGVGSGLFLMGDGFN